MIRKKTLGFLIFSTLVFLVLMLQACSPGGGSNQIQSAEIRATWTPEVHPTDQPYQVKTESLSYLGDLPILVIFGSQDPDDRSPLQAVNITTDDSYDVSNISPAPANTWSRPIVAENKDIYFQVRDILYVLSPGGQTRSIELPYEDQAPAHCNWSWKGRLVCLDKAMTRGFLVDRELNITEIQLQSSGVEDSESFNEPYFINEDTLRAIQTTTKTVNGKVTVYYRELDLETIALEEQRISINCTFNQNIYWSKDSNQMNLRSYIREEGNPDVVGISDDGEKIFLRSRVRREKGDTSTLSSLIETYEILSGEIIHFFLEINNPVVEDHSYGNILITAWQYDEESGISDQPRVYDLESGKMIFEVLDYHDDDLIFSYILSFKDSWIAVDSIRLRYYHETGEVMERYYYTNEIYESIGKDSYCTVTQPMEP